MRKKLTPRSYNANVKELQDTPGSEYFQFLSRKAHEGASNQAKVDVANARMIGEIGEAEKKGKTRQEISKIDAATAVLETQRKSEKAQADAELTTTQTKLNMGIKLAQIQASRQAESKDAELQRDVETKRGEMELERRRATDLVHAKIERESAQQKADAKLYADTKGADGAYYKQKQEAEAACKSPYLLLSEKHNGNIFNPSLSRFPQNQRSRSRLLRPEERSRGYLGNGKSLRRHGRRPGRSSRPSPIHDASRRHLRETRQRKCQRHPRLTTENIRVE